MRRGRWIVVNLRCRRWMFNYNIHIIYLEYYLALLFGNDAYIWNRQQILNSAARPVVNFISILVLLLYIWQLLRSLQQRYSHSYLWSLEFYLHVENTWRIAWTFTSTWIHPSLFGEVRVAHLFSFLCCPIMPLYVLSSVLLFPLRFPHTNDIRFVSVSNCLL